MKEFISNIEDLRGGELVSWVHPETGKVYDFEVTAVNRRDKSQPVKIVLITKLEEDEEIVVDSLVKLYEWVTECWSYRDAEHLQESGYKPKDLPTALTLDKLFYTNPQNS